MVIYKDLRWVSNSEYPDTDFQGDADYVVSDDSELAFKMQMYYPHAKLITDDDDNLIDIEEYYTVEELKSMKKQEINQSCNKLIHSGYDYNGEHFDLTNEDQINMMASLKKAESGLSVRYHSSKPNEEGSNPCRLYSAEEFIQIATAITKFKEDNLTYCNLLKLQVDEMTDEEEIKSVVYGTTQLNEKYQAIYDNIT